MPSPQRIDAFVAMVESGSHVEAIEDFYHPEATMQENLNPPRVGRMLLIEHERKALAGMKEIRSRKVGPVLVDGDQVMINWVFDSTDLKGRSRTIDEIACQTWQGERILRERFYYAPAKLQVKPDADAGGGDVRPPRVPHHVSPRAPGATET